MSDHLLLTDTLREFLVRVHKAEGAQHIAFFVLDPCEPGGQYHLGIAVANMRGYYPVSVDWAWYSDEDTASEDADAHNACLGLERDEASRIVLSAMGGQPFQA